jgi:hypothetical protein
VNTPPSRAESTSPWFDAGGNVICSTNERRPGSFPPPSAPVAALPAAKHVTARTQVMVFKKLSAATFGLGSIDHEEPFQFSMRACGRKLLPPPPPNGPRAPTTQHCVALMHETLLRMPGMEESGTDPDVSVQLEPSQCCSRSPDATPVESVVAPEAQQSVALTQVMPLR